MSIGIFLAGLVALVGIYAICALGLNLQFGQTGLVNFGFVAYFAVGAYVSVILTISPPGPDLAYWFGFGLPMWVGFVGGAVAAGCLAFLVGLPTLHLGIDYFVVVTFAVGEVLRYVLINENWLTNGVTGFYSLKQPFRELFGSLVYEYFFAALVLAILIATYLVVERICRSPFGRTLKAIRENESVCLSLGKKVPFYKMKSFVFGSMIAGLGGALYVRFTTLASPNLFGPSVTFTTLLGIIIGGKGNNKGVVLGTLVYIGVIQMTEFFQVSAAYAVRLSALRNIAMGLLLVLILKYMPDGIMREPKARSEELGR